MAATRALTNAEQSTLLAALDRSRDQLLLRFGFHTGFRISELLRLTFADVWAGGAPRAELTIGRRNLKGGSGVGRRRVRSRTVPLHPSLKAALQSYVLARYPTSEPTPEDVLFCSREGENRPISYSQAYRIIKTAATQLGDTSRIGWHSARKSFVRSVYDNSGHDLVLTQKVVGHSSVLTTSRYLESTDASVVAAILGVAAAAFIPPASAPAVASIPAAAPAQVAAVA